MGIDKILASLPTRTDEQLSNMLANAIRTTEGQGPENEVDARMLRDAVLEEKMRREGEHRTELAKLNPTERIKRAFKNAPLTDTERMAVGALLANPGATSKSLTEFCGWGDLAWNLIFGTMCAQRAAMIGDPPISPERGEPFFSALLADFDYEARTFSMRPEAVNAFAALGVR